MKEKVYLCIDLKSFYASVECVERGLDPMTTNLVVADPSRSEGTICLAVSPSMKALGVKNRCRVFEIPKSIDYIMAPPRLQKYIDYSAEIYGVYLNYISKDDIYVYSIDECFLDVTDYLKLYNKTPREMAVFLMGEITSQVGVRATCGIGTNLYLAKVALDITAKHSPDFIGELNEISYRETLWDHKPITDFWRVGRGTAKRLAKYGIYTMGDITEADEDLMYKVFGIDAELLIDHAWGLEPTTIKDIKAYKPKSNSLSRGQVLMRDYSFEEGRLIVKEMMELLSLEMVKKNLVTESVTLQVGYTHKVEAEPAHGTISMDFPTNAGKIMVEKISELYDRIMDEDLPIRRVYINCNNVKEKTEEQQLNFFEVALEDDLKRENDMQQAINSIKSKFGKNAMFKGMDLEEAATTLERNLQIGGHKSGNEK
ncbi:MAG: DNA repair protein [Firmicutes bacterium]|nr:DNA repair protein [Bacillota bacterium]